MGNIDWLKVPIFYRVLLWIFGIGILLTLIGIFTLLWIPMVYIIFLSQLLIINIIILMIVKFLIRNELYVNDKDLKDKYKKVPNNIVIDGIELEVSKRIKINGRLEFKNGGSIKGKE